MGYLRLAVILGGIAVVFPFISLCTFRGWLTAFPSTITFFIDPTFWLKVIVPIIWMTLTILCLPSAIGMISFLHHSMIRNVRHLLSQLDKPTIVLMLFSFGYNLYLCWFVYTQWSHDFSLFMALLELLPTFALGFQILLQSSFLIFARALMKGINEMNEKHFLLQTYFHVLLNLAFLYHPLSMLFVSLLMRDHDMKVIVFEGLAVLEVVFRSYSAVYFHTIAKWRHATLEKQKHKVMFDSRECSIDEAIKVIYPPPKPLGTSVGDKVVCPYCDFPIESLSIVSQCTQCFKYPPGLYTRLKKVKLD